MKATWSAAREQWSEFEAVVETCREKLRCSYRGAWFRGHESSDWSLSPGAFRSSTPPGLTDALVDFSGCPPGASDLRRARRLRIDEPLDAAIGVVESDIAVQIRRLAGEIGKLLNQLASIDGEISKVTAIARKKFHEGESHDADRVGKRERIDLQWRRSNAADQLAVSRSVLAAFAWWVSCFTSRAWTALSPPPMGRSTQSTFRSNKPWSYQQTETPRLAKDMPRKVITVTQDETFTGGLCLVATEPVSHFMILAQLALARDQNTWNALMAPALAQLNGEVIQSTREAAPGIVAYVEHQLGAHHAPDLFHVQHERSKAVCAPLATKERAAHKALIEAKEQLDQTQARLESTAAQPEKRGPGRSPSKSADAP